VIKNKIESQAGTCVIPGDFIFGTFADTDEVGKLAPIAEKMRP